MTRVVDSSWFYWALGVAIGLPIGLVTLTENGRPLGISGTGVLTTSGGTTLAKQPR